MNEDKSLDLLVNLSTYKPKYVLVRFLLISTVAFLLILIVGLIINEQDLTREIKALSYLLSIAGYNSITEINLLLINYFEKSKRHWNFYIQTIIILSVSILLFFIWIVIAGKIMGENNLLQNKATQVVLLVGLLLILIHLLVTIISNLAREWMDNKKEINELKQAKLISDYNSLKDRLNPHFLFNNLSVLKSLIHYSPKDAEVFTQNFTNVYRYVLKSHEETIVSLKEELKFLESYIALHKERIGEGLITSIKVQKEDLQKLLPPLSLQLLVENAIKHNVANKSNPLHIEIIIDRQSISVINNLNIKDTTYSTQTGISTLKAQYKMLANKDIEIINDGSEYKVTLPLLSH